MTLVGLAFERRSSPADLLEKIAVNADVLPDVLAHLMESEHITEAVIVSTCMRTEVYCEALRFHAAVDHVLDVLAKSSGVAQHQLVTAAVERFDSVAVDHLFRVTCGLESPVLGEYEILGQVGRAFDAAQQAQTAKTTLSTLFRFALIAGRRARKDTSIAKGTTSIGRAAVDMARVHLGDLSARRVLVIGAGEMGEAMATAVGCAKEGGDVVVCNRTHSRGEDLARRLNGRAAPFETLIDQLPTTDLVLASAGGHEVILDLPAIEQALAKRDGNPMVIVDMGLPRNVDPRAADIAGVTLLAIDDLERFTETSRAGREQEITSVEAIIEDELTAYLRELEVRSLAPLLQQLFAGAEATRAAEVDRFTTQLASFTPAQREIVEAMTTSLIAKLLHVPVARLKATAGTSEGDHLATALRLLLDR